MGDLRSFKNYLMLNWGTPLHVLGLGYCIFMILLLSWTNISFICEKLYGKGNFQEATAFIGVVCFETMINLALFALGSKYNRLDYLIDQEKMRRCSGTKSGDKVERIRSYGMYGNSYFGARYCLFCHFMVPVICHHCPVCDYCVFRKDHHCFFMGGCVGFGNQRYFIVFLFWATLGSMYTLFLVFRLIITVYKPTSPLAWARYLFPVYFIMAIYEPMCDKHEILCVLYVSIVICCTFGSTWFLVYQCAMVVKGRSARGYFCLRDMFPANRNPTIAQRIELVFGPYWAVNFLVPLPLRNKLDESYEHAMLLYYSKAVAEGESIPGKVKRN